MSSRVVYRGETLIVEFDEDNLHELEEDLQEFIDIDEGEELYASVRDGQLVVRILEKNR